ncbi:MAG: aminopeptidase [Gemmatimonadetes bacterium]|nr:aminopeptidase [Gemmatimonadota bacterium]
MSLTPSGGRRRRSRRLVLALALAPLMAGCSPLYVIRAGIAEARILAARRPIPEVILDPATDERTRGKLVLALEARAWAADSLGLDVGDSYTSFTQLHTDTLAMVLSAAYRDRLASKTWWFPVVGRVPYRGYFDLDDALAAQRALESDGLDTYLRPTAAFSTLGWFADPLLSTLLRQDEVELVETILHELSHNHLWVPGHVTFNESYATFVGRAGAVDFFCRRPGGGPDTVKCERARARWRDYQRFSRFMDGLVSELRELYGRADLGPQATLAGRQAIFDVALDRFRQGVQPEFEDVAFSGFLTVPLNNATLLARMRYYHRLGDFQALLDTHGGSVARAVAALEAGLDDVEDPFDLLPRSGTR